MHAEFWLAGWMDGWRAAANPAQMGWKWSAGGKCMTPRARSEKKLHVVQLYNQKNRTALYYVGLFWRTALRLHAKTVFWQLVQGVLHTRTSSTR